MSGAWQKIDGAPIDGVEIVVTDFKSPPQFARWVESKFYIEGGYWQNRDGKHREQPTHFIQLPSNLDAAAPAKSKKSLIHRKEPIESLGLDSYIVSRLSKEGIKTLGDLLSKSSIDLHRLPRLGVKSIKSIREKVRANGLFFNER